MAIVENHPAGSFSWIELSTSNQDAAKEFYSSLFGWSIVDSPMGENAEHGMYTMFKIDGLDVAAAYTIMQDEIAMGVPPHWNLYVATDDTDKSVARAKELGGKVLAGPFDVMSYGRMAVLQDPTGAVVSVWQPKSHIGIRRMSEPNTFCWADLSSPNQAGGAAFYSGLFGWKLDPGKDGTGYLHIENGGTPIGGIVPPSMRDPKAPPHWLIYIQVANCVQATVKAKELGAKTFIDNVYMENAGTFTLLADPQGAMFSLFQPELRQ